MPTYGTSLLIHFDIHSEGSAAFEFLNIPLQKCEESSTKGRYSTRLSASPDADDSIGSQGDYVVEVAIGSTRHSFGFSFVCNNKLQNSVTVRYSNIHWVLDIQPTPEVIKTQAPLDVVITLTEK